jgi:hypothetical protein
LVKLSNQGLSGEPLQAVRAIAVLERIGTLDARQLLETLAGGAPEAEQSREAKAGMVRLTRSAAR